MVGWWGGGIIGWLVADGGIVELWGGQMVGWEDGQMVNGLDSKMVNAFSAALISLWHRHRSGEEQW